MTATSSIIIGNLAAPRPATDERRRHRRASLAAAARRTKSFREDTRERRIEIARELEHLSGKKVSWGVRVGDDETLFTHLAAPVMTRLRQPERHVLDTLVDAGVARSRSEALAWCVKLVGRAVRQLARRAARGDGPGRRGPQEGPGGLTRRPSRRLMPTCPPTGGT